jgi:uncharacterized protein with HEPN domain
MRRNPHSFLWDVCDSADAIASFIQGRDFDAYMADRMLRSAVERQFEIIGEALSQLSKIEPALAARVSDIRRIVGFRNTLIHGYDRVDDASVWRIVAEDLPSLRREAAALLADLGDAPQ